MAAAANSVVDYPVSNDRKSVGMMLQTVKAIEEPKRGNSSTIPIHSVSQKNLSMAAVPHSSAQEGSSTRIGSASGYSLRKFDPNEAMLH